MPEYRFIFENDDDFRQFCAIDLLDAFQYVTRRPTNAVIAVFSQIEKIGPDGISWGLEYSRDNTSHILRWIKLFNNRSNP